jgi:hypothetical protein
MTMTYDTYLLRSEKARMRSWGPRLCWLRCTDTTSDAEWFNLPIARPEEASRICMFLPSTESTTTSVSGEWVL